MSPSQTKTSIARKQLSFRLSPILRSLFAWIGGFLGSLFLLGITFLIGPVAVIGFIVLGQYLLFEQLVDSSYQVISKKAIPYEIGLIISILVYSALWGLIAGLLVSHEKKQRIVGWALLVIYIAWGYLSLKIYGSIMFPT